MIDVAVVGAGAAGLTAARMLARAGLQVEVVEARDRVGGRVAQSGGVELGAEFIHGPAAQTRALLREIGVTDVGMSGRAWTFAGTGEPTPDDGHFSSHGPLFADAQNLAEDESVDGYLLRLRGAGVASDVLVEIRAFVEGFDAADPARASAMGIANEFLSGVDDRSARPVGGYGAMFDYLRSQCEKAGVRIRFAMPVDRIAWRNGAVEIDDIRSRAAIVTIPVGVLRAGDVAFEPALPDWKRCAIEAIETGPVVKVVLRFRKPFWRDMHGGRYRDAGFFQCLGQPFSVLWTQFPIEASTLTAWVGGPKTGALVNLSSADLTARAIDQCAALFAHDDAVRANFEGISTHDWIHDPFSRGAYSYLLVGGGDARKALGRSVDNVLFFAGEATSEDGEQGTVNGAFASGERAAREVLATFGAKER
jgi:monoamine oxidase